MANFKTNLVSDYVNNKLTIEEYILNSDNLKNKTIAHYCKGFDKDGAIVDVDTEDFTVSYDKADVLSLYLKEYDLSTFSENYINSIFSLELNTITDTLLENQYYYNQETSKVQKAVLVDQVVVLQDVLNLFENDNLLINVPYNRTDFVNTFSLKTAIAYYQDLLIKQLLDNSLDAKGLAQRRDLLIMFLDTINYLELKGQYNTIIDYLTYLEKNGYFKYNDYYLNTVKGTNERSFYTI